MTNILTTYNIKHNMYMDKTKSHEVTTYANQITKSKSLTKSHYYRFCLKSLTQSHPNSYQFTHLENIDSACSKHLRNVKNLRLLCYIKKF